MNSDEHKFCERETLPEMNINAPIPPVKRFKGGSEGYESPRPGSASYEPDESLESIDYSSRLATAHYANQIESEAQETWKVETICFTCACSPVCRISNGIQDSLTVISRCLAYIPL